MNLNYITVTVTLIVLISYILLKKYKRNVARKELKRALEEDKNIDPSENIVNLMNSISKSKVLYKILIKKIHPDRFQDEDKKEKATLLSQRITKSKKNYNELISLKKEVEALLDETIN